MKSKFLFIILMIAAVASVNAQDFIQRQGKKLRYQGKDIYLRGMAFGNLVWDENYSPASHHSEIDFRRVHNLGMNAIRFYISYKTLENDNQPYLYKQSGWDWLDQNIKWAKANGIYLILNLHVPQGGYQSQCKGEELWTIPANQQRVAAMWKAIAARYKDEPQIAGYDILNEPTPSGSINNWSILAQRIIDSIRTADKNHLIITERALALNCNYSYQDANNNYPQIAEDNLMYTVHLYDPFEYTHQNLDWANTGDGGKYPDNDRITAPADAKYATGNYANPSVSPGTSNWAYKQGVPYQITEDSLIFGRVVFLSNKLGAGKAYYDDIEVKELDADGNLIRVIMKTNLTSAATWFWSENNTGGVSNSTSGHNDNFSVSVTGNTGATSVILPESAFKVVKGRKYVINGWIRGESIPAGASASITTEFYSSPSKTGLSARNYDYMVKQITSYSKYIEDKGFPVYFGEFGVARNAFENDKGGAIWVRDAMHIFDSLGYHFTYHSYKESSFGYYDGWDRPVDTTTVNSQLTTVFRDFFGTDPTGIDHQTMTEMKAISVFPNPATDFINFEYSGKKDLKSVEIMDMTGKVLQKNNRGYADLKDFPKGMFMLKFIFTDGYNYIRFIKN